METKKITIRGVEYTCHEMSMKVLRPVMQGDEGLDHGQYLIGNGVSVNGTLLGNDGYDELGMYVVKRLMPLVNEVNDLVGDEEEAEKKS